MKLLCATLERQDVDSSIHEEACGCASTGAPRQASGNIQVTVQVENRRTGSLHYTKRYKTTNLSGPSDSINLARRKRMERTSDAVCIGKIITAGGITLRGYDGKNNYKGRKKLDKRMASTFQQWKVSYILNLNTV